MSNLPQNVYNNIPGAPPMYGSPGAPPLNHHSNVNQLPASQLPPGYGQMKQDTNYNSSLPVQSSNSVIGIQNHFQQSGNNSPALSNASVIPSVPPANQSSPLRPQFKPPTPVMNQNASLSTNSSPRPNNMNVPPNPLGYQQQQQHQQINNNAPPLIPSSHYGQSVNGPPGTTLPVQNQYPPASSMFSPPVVSPVFNSTAHNRLPETSMSTSHIPPVRPPTISQPGSVAYTPNVPLSGPPISQTGSYSNQPPRLMPPLKGAQTTPMSGLPPATMPVNGPTQYVPQLGPPPQLPSGPRGQYSMQNGPPLGAPPTLAAAGGALPPPPGAPMSGSMQNRYPPMPPSGFPPAPPAAGMAPPQYGMPGVTQQMAQLSVTKQGFDELWGHHTVDLMQTRHILPEYPEDPPEIKLGPPFTESPNCSPDIFRCTINRIPETNSLLQKSRLPLGILIHPFKDLNYLPVIQCATIVRCRACRTYINPFVYFVDSKRWKCNLCYRVNDLPEEFQYDPVSRSYGAPERRPEARSATIEFIAPAEYMLRPPQPAAYVFVLDTSAAAAASGYLRVACESLLRHLEELPGDARTLAGFVTVDAHVHAHALADGAARPRRLTLLDAGDVFLPAPRDLVVNVRERLALVRALLTSLAREHEPASPGPGGPTPAPAPAAACALGAALQLAYKLMAPTGGRITVFQTCLPNTGPGALKSREDPNARSGAEVAHLAPATDFYKRLALDCSAAQVAVDLVLLNSHYADLATLSGVSKFSGGSIMHFPLFAGRAWQAAALARALARYLTRKIGFEAVMRVRCTRGVGIHTFHGNFFVRSTDLLSLPNVSPDAGFAMQLSIDEPLSDLQHVCFQAALLYTSSRGERRIRVHTLALPVATTLPAVLHSADTPAIVALLAKMAADRCVSAGMAEAREALVSVAVDALAAHRVATHAPAGPASPGLPAPASLALLPLYLLALIKSVAFRGGVSTRLDDRVAAMCDVKTLPLRELLRRVHPDLYAVHDLRRPDPDPHHDPRHDPGHDPARDDADPDNDRDTAPDPPRLQLSAESLSVNGAYLLDDGATLVLYVCRGVGGAFLSDVFGVAAFSQVPDEARSLPVRDTEGSALLHAFIERLNDDRPYPSDLLVLRDDSPAKARFTSRLLEDRQEAAFSYYEFLQHVKAQLK